MEARGSLDAERAQMNGALLWFNEHKATGVIVSDGGERLPVAATAFADGDPPVGRCAGTRVAFDVVDEEGGREAVRVVRVSVEASRRARLRKSQRRS